MLIDLGFEIGTSSVRIHFTRDTLKMWWVSVCAILLASINTVTAGCGEPEIQGLRVIAGKEAVRGSWPWQILLLNKRSPICGGSLISPHWVITAAHCVVKNKDHPENLVVVVGEHNWVEDKGTEAEYPVEKIISHEQYNSPSRKNNDIALLKLKSPVVFNTYVQPVCLPSADPLIGSECYITGWGKIEHPGKMHRILQQGRLPVISNALCRAKNSIVIPVPITDAMVCAGNDASSSLSGCHGDSGGPLVCFINGKWELHGAVSFGSKKCESANMYTVFARVYHFKGWILDNMANG